LSALLGTLAAVGLVSPSYAQDVSALRAPLIELPVAEATTDSVDVYIDKIQVNAFSRFDANAIVIDLPFAQAADAFEVAVVDRATGAALFTGMYRMATGELFDRVETGTSFENALSWRFKSRQKPPADNFESTDWSEDYRAAGSFAGYRGNWSTTLEGELVGTDDDLKTLRTDGPKHDLSRGLGTVGYRDDAVFGVAGIGDVTVNSFNTLVHGPLSTRGVAFDAGFIDDAVKISGGNVYGNGIVGFQRGPEAWDAENRRTAADISMRPLQTPNLNVEFFGSLFDAARPAGQSFNVATVTEGEKNTVLGSGMRVDMWENRIALQSEIARSRYANPESLNFLNEFGGSTDIGPTFGNAQTHRVDAAVWQGEELQVNAFGGYSLIEPLFNAIESFTIADRETWEYGATANYDIVSLSLARTVFDNNVDDTPNILTTRQRSTLGNLSFDLERFRAAPAEPPADGEPAPEPGFFNFLSVIPSSISVTGSDERVEALNSEIVTINSSLDGSEIPNSRNVAAGLGFLWIWPNGDTSLNLMRSIFDTRQVGRETADTVDNFADISQTFRGDIWSSQTRLGYGRSYNKDVTTQSTTHRYEAGQSFTLNLEDWPTASVSGNVQVEKTVSIVDGTSSLSNSWQANASLEFSKYFPTSIQDYSPSLALVFGITDIDRRDSDFGNTSFYEYNFTLVSGFRF
jgi:hypothetical protein